MESPESSKPNITETAHAQVSPISSFISNLSPIPNGLVTCIGKGSDSNILVNDQIGSHIEYSNQLLTDVSIYPNVSSGSTIKESEYIHQRPDAVTSSKEYATELNYEHNARINEEAVDPPALPRQIEHVHKEDTPIHANVIEFGMKIEPELPVSHSLTNQDKKDTATERKDGKQAAPLDQSFHMRLGSTQTDEENELVEATGAVLTAPILKEEQNNPKAFQHCGIRRRCLQFEDAQQKVISNHPAQNPDDSTAPISESSGMPPGVNEKQVGSIQSVLSAKKNFSSTSQIPIPLGIGLHLNTVINSVQAGSGTMPNVRSVQICNFGIRGKKPLRILKSHLSDNSKFSSMSSPMESALNNSVNVNLVENETTSGNTSKSKTENDGVSDEFNKSSAQTKRKRSLESSDGDGCKRCNCKKSSCLKLYCDCFAAGLYCAEPCTCYECRNRKEFEDTVLDRRQQIESRNPLAFTPKVIQSPIEPLTSSFGGNQAQFTPSSARHKRGCNCKKSMCLKKYCECFLANVGCSDGCRCEGCRNGFGRKGEYGVIKDLHAENTSGRTDGSLVENIELLGSGNSSYQSKLQNPYNSTPLTPAFQYSNQKKDASEAPYGFPSQNYFLSPESGLTFVEPYGISPVSPTVIGAVPFDPGDWSNNAKDQSVSGDRQYSSVSSLRWRGSPITPMTQYSGTKLLDVDSELSNLMQDDNTPDILKDVPAPLNTVKVSSPNKKRVSPPHHGRLFGPSSSSGLTSGRKFILKSVPSFPALTPCIDSKMSAAEQIKDPQSLISKKDKNL